MIYFPAAFRPLTISPASIAPSWPTVVYLYNPVLGVHDEHIKTHVLTACRGLSFAPALVLTTI